MAVFLLIKCFNNAQGSSNGSCPPLLRSHVSQGLNLIKAFPLVSAFSPFYGIIRRAARLRKEGTWSKSFLTVNLREQMSPSRLKCQHGPPFKALNTTLPWASLPILPGCVILLQLNRLYCRLIGSTAWRVFFQNFEITSHPPVRTRVDVVCINQAFSGMEEAQLGHSLDYLCYVRSAGVRVKVFLNRACERTNRTAMCHLLDPVSCWITEFGEEGGRERRHQGMFHVLYITAP